MRTMLGMGAGPFWNMSYQESAFPDVHSFYPGLQAFQTNKTENKSNLKKKQKHNNNKITNTTALCGSLQPSGFFFCPDMKKE